MTQLKRLLDEPGSDLDRVLLEAGLDEQPPKASLDRTLVALGVGSATAIGAGAIGASGAGASLGGAKGLFGVGLAKWVGGALLATAAIGGGYVITQRSEPAAVVAPAAGEQAGKTPAVPAPGTGQELVAAADPQPTAAEEGGEELAPSPATLPGPASAPASPTAQDPQPGVVAPSKASPSKEAPVALAEKQSGAGPSSVGPSSVNASGDKASTDKPKSEKPKPDLTAGGGSLSDELRTLDVARKASLAGDNDACLATLTNYGKKFPKGQLLSEAQAMKASCAAKKAAAAP